MAEDRTDRLALPLLLAGQAQKEVTHNEALLRLDIAAVPAVQSADIAVPPGAPVGGQCWIVAAGASGAWAGREGDIAGWTSGGWRFVQPLPGMALWVEDRGHRMMWRGGWTEGAVRADGIYRDGVKVLGSQGDAIAAPLGGSIVDVESRVAINAILSMLHLHGLIAFGS